VWREEKHLHHLRYGREARKLWSYLGTFHIYSNIECGTEKEIFISDFPLAYTIGIISLELVGVSREKKKN
jgi:hypothetical protein